jgi:hypothetical protein
MIIKISDSHLDMMIKNIKKYNYWYFYYHYYYRCCCCCKLEEGSLYYVIDHATFLTTFNHATECLAMQFAMNIRKHKDSKLSQCLYLCIFSNNEITKKYEAFTIYLTAKLL